MCNFDISSRTRFLVNMLCHLIRYSYKIINKILFPKKNPEQAWYKILFITTAHSIYIYKHKIGRSMQLVDCIRYQFIVCYWDNAIKISKWVLRIVVFCNAESSWEYSEKYNESLWVLFCSMYQLYLLPTILKWPTI